MAKGKSAGAGKRVKKVLKANASSVSQGSIRRLARRGGVKRIAGPVYGEVRDVLLDHPFLTAAAAQLLHDFNVEYDEPAPPPDVVAARLAELIAGDHVTVGEEADRGVAVADVGAQQRCGHDEGLRSIAMSSTFAEWVSAPTAR